MLELFIGLSIDFILVKSWWFDKAKVIKHRAINSDAGRLVLA